MRIKRFVALILALLMTVQLLPAGAEDEGWHEAVSDVLEAPVRHAVAYVAAEETLSTVFKLDGAALGQLPDAPEAAGKRFIGWYSELAAVSAETIVTGDMTVSAVYTDVDADLEARKANARFLYEDAGQYASVSIFGSYNGNQRPSADRNANVLGAEVLEAWTANNIRNNTSLTLEAVITALPEGRTLSAYTVIDDQVVRLVASGLTLGDRVTFDLVRSGAKGIALTADAAEEPEEPDGEETVDWPEGALYANSDFYLTGKVPGNGVIDVTPVTVEIDGEDVIAAYDIRIYTNEKQREKGKTWQPAGKKVQVHFYNEAFASNTLNIYHLETADAAAEYVDTRTAEDGWLTFEAESFSVYAVTRSIEKTVTIGGATYKITVEYDSRAGIPDGAELAVTELPAEEYLAGVAGALNLGDGDTVYYNKFLDIAIVHEGREIEPRTAVQVTVELLDVDEGAEALEVVHFGENGPEKVASSATADGVVTFTADSLSPFGFTSILSALTGWADDLFSFSILGFSSLLSPTYSAAELPSLEEGLEALEAYTLRSSGLLSGLTGLFVRVARKAALLLGERESVAVYTMKDGAAGDALTEDLGTQEQTLSLGDADGFVLVRDTGFRRLSLDLETVRLDGLLPKEAAAEAQDAQAMEAVQALEGDVLAAYDISIDENGQSYQPDGDHPVEVTIRGVEEPEGAEMRVWHILEDGAQEEITEFTARDGCVSFTAPGFSVYAVTKVTLVTNVTTGDGATYEITVSYDASAGIPMEGTALAVSEVLPGDENYDMYIRESAIQAGVAYDGLKLSRVFDIRIVNENEPETVYEPQNMVEVSIRLLGEALESYEKVYALHFVDDGLSDGYSVYAMDSTAEGELITFNTGSFSVYSVVGAETEPVPGGDEIADLAELADNYDQGFTLQYGTNNYFRNTLNATNGVFLETNLVDIASVWYFEPVEDAENTYYVYTYIDGSEQKQYMHQKKENDNLMELSEADKTPFELIQADDSKFYFKYVDGTKVRYLQHSGGGGGIRMYTDNNNAINSQIIIRYAGNTIQDDYFQLNGKTYGIVYVNEDITAAGLLAGNRNASTLKAAAMYVRPDVLDQDGYYLVAPSAELAEWTFHNVSGNTYYITTEIDGVTHYIQLEAGKLQVTQNEDDKTELRIDKDSDDVEGKYAFYTKDNYAITYSGSPENGFTSAQITGTSWLNFVVKAQTLTDDDFVIYSARKASVSDDESVHDREVNIGTAEEPVIKREQSQVILYTRQWNEQTLRYEFYAVDYDGSLIRVYESGDMLQWFGNAVSSAVWNFTEYHYDDGTPNYYYELQNDQFGNFIAPQVTNGQVTSGSTLGINLPGRREGRDYTTVIAWDDDYYAYVGLKIEDGHVVSCPLDEAEDFYFAVFDQRVSDSTVEHLTTVATVDNDTYGITMKMMNFGTIGDNRAPEQVAFFKNDNNNTGLLSTNLGADGYPIGTSKTSAENRSLAALFNNGNKQDVNHLFLQSIYNESGYFEYDSTRNFAHLDTGSGNFTVYDQLAAIGTSSGPTRTHGQFMPYNQIAEGQFASVTNQTDVNAQPLSDFDPRKGEKLYLIEQNDADYFFGMELSASFTQTENGKDDWGHDIIFEFSGDDDFWLYVDGELVLDLGGVHSAMSGSVNFRTGEVIGRGGNITTLRKIFEANYKARHPGVSNAEVQAYLSNYFEGTGTVFKDFSAHTMKVFYMERGAGASNLHMRFNLASIKPGTVMLGKELSGAASKSNVLAEFPFQVRYLATVYDNEGYPATDEENRPITIESVLGAQNENHITVNYANTNRQVEILPSFTTADGITYENVFLLKAGETVEVNFPDQSMYYAIVECGVNTAVYDQVQVNNGGVAVAEGVRTEADPLVQYHATDVDIIDTAGNYGDLPRRDYGIAYDVVGSRPRITYNNHVPGTALRTLSITKILYDVDGKKRLHYPDNGTLFSFRLYLGSENASDADLPVANMFTYFVKNPSGEYCRWDADTQKFASLGVTEYNTLAANAAQLKSASFTTSMNGSISKIPADYTVEVRELIITTKYKVQERGDEIPRGYTLRSSDGYVRVDVTPENSTGSVPYSGTINVGEDPQIQVRNQKGWGLTARKVWTDRDFMKTHGDVYFAIYVQTASGDRLYPGSVRRLSSADNEIYYFFEDLKFEGETYDFKDFIIREVKIEGAFSVDENDVVDISGASLTPIEDRQTVTVPGIPSAGADEESYTYKVIYVQGQPTGHNENIRIDTVTNSRPGIKLVKTQWNTEQKLADAVFTLTTESGTNAAAAAYTSRAGDGLITIAYLPSGVYTLTETSTPKGYAGLPQPVVITVGENNTVTGITGPEGYFERHDDEDAEMTTTIYVKNRTSGFAVMKTKEGDIGTKLQNAVFALYLQVEDVNGELRKYYSPLEGYARITTDSNGVLPGVDLTLPANTYYLEEIAAPQGYSRLERDVIFTIGNNGEITLDESCAGFARLDQEIDEISGNTSYSLYIYNQEATPAPTAYSESAMPYMALLALGTLLLIAEAAYRRRRRRENGY